MPNPWIHNENKRWKVLIFGFVVRKRIRWQKQIIYIYSIYTYSYEIWHLTHDICQTQKNMCIYIYIYDKHPHTYLHQWLILSYLIKPTFWDLFLHPPAFNLGIPSGKPMGIRPVFQVRLTGWPVVACPPCWRWNSSYPSCSSPWVPRTMAGENHDIKVGNLSEKMQQLIAHKILIFCIQSYQIYQSHEKSNGFI